MRYDACSANTNAGTRRAGRELPDYWVLKVVRRYSYRSHMRGRSYGYVAAVAIAPYATRYEVQRIQDITWQRIGIMSRKLDMHSADRHFAECAVESWIAAAIADNPTLSRGRYDPWLFLR